jgi:hypothetical protein
MVKHERKSASPTTNNFAAREKPHAATGGVQVAETRYVLKLSLPLDDSLNKMAERMDMDKGKVISHALTLLALALENKRRFKGNIGLLGNDDKDIVRVIPVNDNGLPGDLPIAREGDEPAAS